MTLEYNTPISQYKITNNVFATKIIKYTTVLKMVKTELFSSYFKVI